MRLIEADNETLVSVLCCFHCGSLPKARSAPGRALSSFLVGCNEDCGSYQLFRHTQWLLFTWNMPGSDTEAQGMEQWQPPTCSLLCPCLNLQERIWERHQGESSDTSTTSLWWLMAVTSDLCPRNEQAWGWNHSCKAQADWHRATGLSWKVWGAQA